MAKATKKPRPRRGKQLRIPSLEPESIPDVDKAAETYHEVKLERCKLSKDEDEAKDALILKMTEHGLQRHETPDGLIVTLTELKKVKTTRKGQGENGDGGDE